MQEYYFENKEEIIKNIKEYRKNNLEKCKKNARKREKERTKTDTNYRIKRFLATRIRLALKGKYKKSKSTVELIGCSIQNLKYYLQWTAIQNGYLNFDINNYSTKKYHVDHIIPRSVFNLSDSNQQRECFNWRNMQILKAEENLKKNDKF
jgi:hypothetical protein